jgi:hypothetical protein
MEATNMNNINLDTCESKAINELVREEKNKYFREYNANNKERIKKIKEKYWKNRVLKKLNQTHAEKAGDSNDSNSNS